MSHRPRRIIAGLVLSAAITAAAVITGQATPGSAAPHAAPSVPPRPSDPVPSAPNPSPYPPTAPTGLTATAVHAGSVTLSWTASRPGCCSVDHYLIVYSQAFDDLLRSVTVGNVTTATVTNQIYATQEYTFKVVAVDVVGHQSGSSNGVTVVTPASDSASDTTPPSTPADLTLTGISPAGAALTWSPATDNVGVVGYNVYRFDGWYTSSLSGTTSGTTFTAPIVGGRDSFYVRARDAAGNLSPASNLVYSTPMSPPPVSSPPVSSSPPPAPACRATYRTNSTWPGGFVAEVTVTNLGETALDGWTAAFTFGGDQKVSSSWNGTFAQSGATVTLTPVTWNRRLGPGATTTVGLLGSGAAGAPPAAVTCTG